MTLTAFGYTATIDAAVLRAITSSRLLADSLTDDGARISDIIRFYAPSPQLLRQRRS